MRRPTPVLFTIHDRDTSKPPSSCSPEFDTSPHDMSASSTSSVRFEPFKLLAGTRYVVSGHSNISDHSGWFCGFRYMSPPDTSAFLPRTMTSSPASRLVNDHPVRLGSPSKCHVEVVPWKQIRCGPAFSVCPSLPLLLSTLAKARASCGRPLRGRNAALLNAFALNDSTRRLFSRVPAAGRNSVASLSFKPHQPAHHSSSDSILAT
ncbi:hypothetical protein DFP72DRAFT_1072678 [Ephemerocybe angulata]|uniref:Uncharacterized protein n=1 Tax=Ephemerocybe angulata TaxID=980116 RepID=A0A8H6M0Q3_9AGAR|nr:hypothetical protein DFP72DRAFT_1072678 [Tulosesus angulatus]